jgi:hypothetical protein
MIRVDGDYSETASDVLVIHLILAQSSIFYFFCSAICLRVLCFEFIRLEVMFLM